MVALVATVILAATADRAQAFFDDPYIPFCHSGYCGGGDFYLGFCCRKCCNPRRGPIRDGYAGAQRPRFQNSNPVYASSTNQTLIPPAPSVTQASAVKEPPKSP